MSAIESSAERLIELLDVGADVTDRPDAVELDQLGTVQFENVTFAYPGKQVFALRNVSFRLERGKTLALVGPQR